MTRRRRRTTARRCRTKNSFNLRSSNGVVWVYTSPSRSKWGPEAGLDRRKALAIRLYQTRHTSTQPAGPILPYPALFPLVTLLLSPTNQLKIPRTLISCSQSCSLQATTISARDPSQYRQWTCPSTHNGPPHYPAARRQHCRRSAYDRHRIPPPHRSAPVYSSLPVRRESRLLGRAATGS
jgi:hypothetical protein